MRIAFFVAVATLAGFAGADPTALMRALHFTDAEIGQARAGQPVVRLLESSQRAELGIAGAIRLNGDRARLAGWIRQIDHFRGAAELGVARVLPVPPTADGFRDLQLDADEIAELTRCTQADCSLRISSDVLSRVHQALAGNSAEGPVQATAAFREMLARDAAAYWSRGEPALQVPPDASFKALLSRSSVFQSVAPDFASFLQHFPAQPPANVDQCLYWSATPVDTKRVIALHHLAIHRGNAQTTTIVDRTLYASRYFETGALAITLQDDPNGGGYYLVAGSRVVSPELTSTTAVVLRRRIERAAQDGLRTYLEWMRDSLALTPK